MKMVKPLSTNTSKVKAPSIGSKLLALRKDSSCSQGINDVESTSSAIFLKVQELLISCKQMKPRDGKDNVKEKPELSPKWISLLTMEKACLSTISFEGMRFPLRDPIIYFQNLQLHLVIIRKIL